MSKIDSLASYSLLGRSGLRVSPLCLGTMTFGTEWGWGSPKETAFQILDRYLESGGNFLDTADAYTGGSSERIIGEYFKERGTRDRAVIATKFAFGSIPGDPNTGGNSRKNIYRAVEGSLQRLQTDYIDLYWLHVWDGITPIEEVLSTLTDLVRAGKIRYIGLSDTPAWYVARAQTLAETKHFERIAGLQLEYSLVERNIEREHIPAALELGMGVCPWSPLASGMLSGKYGNQGIVAEGDGRLKAFQNSTNPAFSKLFTERNWKITEILKSISAELHQSPARVALNWITKRPGITSTIIGATSLTQLGDNLSSLSFDIPKELSDKLEAASRIELVHPYLMFTPQMQGAISGNTKVQSVPNWYYPKEA
jgi:aryl-alcohol dehydrogenase-like predicted oxidoreductase